MSLQLAASHCPECRKRYDSNIHRKSRDHIIPQCWGAGDIVHGDVRNTRIMCQDCNSWRAHAGHCLAALAIMRDVASDRCQPVKDIAREWDMYAVAAEIEVPAEGQRMAELAALRKRTSKVVSSFYIQQREEAAKAQLAAPPAAPARETPMPPALTPREQKPYTLKSLRAKGPARTLPKELVVINGMVAMRWDIRQTGRAL